jgi:hypothetical protein
MPEQREDIPLGHVACGAYPAAASAGCVFDHRRIWIMAETVHLYVLGKPDIGKIWDKKMAKPAGEALLAGVEKALGASGGKVVKSLAKDEKGFKVTLTLESMEFDEKKSVLSHVVKGVIATLPDDKYLAGLTHSGKLPGVDPKKLEADVKFFCNDSGGKLGEKIRKEVK